MPGKTNNFADAMSRYPSAEIGCLSTGNFSEYILAVSMHNDIRENTSILWERVAEETKRDPQLALLLDALTKSEDWTGNPKLKEFTRYADSLYEADDVVLYNDRVVVPKSLRPIITKNLHAAHQGVSAMERRAHSIVFWPGITQDIAETRATCSHCNTNASSQAQTPSIPASAPSTPFEMIFADFFYFGGNHYLVIGDRLS